MAGVRPAKPTAVPVSTTQSTPTRDKDPDEGDIPNPVRAQVAHINKAVGNHEDPAKVADLIALAVDGFDNYGEEGLSRNMILGIQGLKKNPKDFLYKAYRKTDKAYLDKIAEILLQEYGPKKDVDDEGQEADQDEDQEADQDEAATAADEAVQDETQEAAPAADVPADGTTPEASPDTNPPEPEAAAEDVKADGNGNGKPKKSRKLRTGTRARGQQMPIPGTEEKTAESAPAPEQVQPPPTPPTEPAA